MKLRTLRTANPCDIVDARVALEGGRATNCPTQMRTHLSVEHAGELLRPVGRAPIYTRKISWILAAPCSRQGRRQSDTCKRFSTWRHGRAGWPPPLPQSTNAALIETTRFVFHAFVWGSPPSGGDRQVCAAPPVGAGLGYSKLSHVLANLKQIRTPNKYIASLGTHQVAPELSKASVCLLACLLVCLPACWQAGWLACLLARQLACTHGFGLRCTVGCEFNFIFMFPYLPQAACFIKHELRPAH